MQKWLKKEKELRKKGFADKQIEETVAFLRQKGIDTVWDVQAAYDAGPFGLKDRCSFGSHGLCCRNCHLGPCRLDGEEIPFHMKLAVPKTNRSSCGKTADSMVAGMLLQTVISGTSAHLGHAIHTAKTFVKAAEGSKTYPIKDEQKLRAVAKDLGINVNGKNTLTIAKEVGQKAMEDLIGPGEGLMSFALALAPKNIDKLAKADLIPHKGAAEAIVQGLHSTVQGMTSSTHHLLMSCLKFGIIDVLSLYISTQLQDILFGTPAPKESRIGMDVLDREKVNILVHGHVPVLSEMVVAYAQKLEDKARAAGAKGINVAGICCTGNEVLVRHGIPMAGSTIMQELVVGTGLVDAVCVDVQCVYPSLSAITRKLHTRLITTMPELRMDNDIYIEFTPDNADASAARIIEEAIAAFQARSAERTFLPNTKGHNLLGGFSAEVLMSVLEKLNPEKPLKPLVDLITNGSIQGIAVLAGCLSPKIQTDMSFITIAKELLRNNVLILATGCAATACARHGLMTGEAKDLAGDSLRGVLDTLGKAAGLNDTIPPVLHFGSCVDNSRCAVLASAIADYLQTSIDKLPLVASAAEHVVEKATAIYMGVIALGITTHIGVTPKLGGSPHVIDMLTRDLEKITGSNLIIEIDPHESARAMLNHIQKKRKGLGI
ncbi:MAG: anaerobic carbon-monoxide dehydrogenase catalytic subunit [wastewater metagenome]|nr:anaerobic carbon-monoxide dehydrogenase catalytic subunit [Candidatus Loosdrechtia aerotolerans]